MPARLTAPQRLEKYGNPLLKKTQSRMIPTTIMLGPDLMSRYQRILLAPEISELVSRGTLFVSTMVDEWPEDVQSFNPRKIAGSTTWSLHSWALAVDVFGSKGKKDPKTGRKLMSARWRQEFIEYTGMQWGGLWKRPDPHHYEWPW